MWGLPTLIYLFLSTPSWKIFSNPLLEMASCSLGTGRGFMWCGLMYGYISIYTVLVFQLPSVPSKRNSYLLNKLSTIDHSSSVKCLLSGATLHRSDFCSERLRCDACVAYRPEYV